MLYDASAPHPFRPQNQSFSFSFFFLKTQQQLEKSEQEVRDLLQSLGVEYSNMCLQRWQEDVQQVARGYLI